MTQLDLQLDLRMRNLISLRLMNWRLMNLRLIILRLIKEGGTIDEQ